MLDFLGHINWVFAIVLLIGGRYWGGKFFTISKNPALNFLAFATVFGLLWVAIAIGVDGFKKELVPNIFLTYLFTTSFYELLAKKLLEKVEELANGKTAKPPVNENA